MNDLPQYSRFIACVLFSTIIISCGDGWNKDSYFSTSDLSGSAVAYTANVVISTVDTNNPPSLTFKPETLLVRGNDAKIDSTPKSGDITSWTVGTLSEYPQISTIFVIKNGDTLYLEDPFGSKQPVLNKKPKGDFHKWILMPSKSPGTDTTKHYTYILSCVNPRRALNHHSPLTITPKPPSTWQY